MGVIHLYLLDEKIVTIEVGESQPRCLRKLLNKNCKNYQGLSMSIIMGDVINKFEKKYAKSSSSVTSSTVNHVIAFYFDHISII